MLHAPQACQQVFLLRQQKLYENTYFMLPRSGALSIINSMPPNIKTTSERSTENTADPAQTGSVFLMKSWIYILKAASPYTSHSVIFMMSVSLFSSTSMFLQVDHIDHRKNECELKANIHHQREWLKNFYEFYTQETCFSLIKHTFKSTY